MKMNIAPLEQLLRIFVGTVLLYLMFMNFIGYVGLLGGLLIATGLSGICPAYCPFGFSTRCDSGKSH